MFFDEDLDFQLAGIFRVKHRGGFFNVAPRPYAAISLRLSGVCKFNVLGRKLVSEEGDILYMPKDTPYEAEYTPENEMIVIHLHNCPYPTPEIISAQNQLLVESYFARIYEGWQARRSANYIKSLVYALLDTLERENSIKNYSPTFLRSLEYLDNNYTRSDINIDTLCKSIYVCRSTLQREFLRNLGITPSQYLTKIRMDKALSMLSTGEESVSLVAGACGFSDAKYFARVFKKSFGVSPSETREKLLL